MTYLIKEIPASERPRERFKKYGPASLSNEELLSILMRTGTHCKSVKDLSLELLKEIPINDFANLNYATLKNIKGIGEVKAITILAAIEFGRRVTSHAHEITQIKTGDDAYHLIKDDLENKLQENFLTIFLDNRNQVLAKKIIFIGTVNSSNVCLRDVFREAVKLNCSNIIIAHNHPAGSLTPSYEDIYLTNEFIKIGKIMNINVIDHLIIGKNNYYSLREGQSDLFANKN